MKYPINVISSLTNFKKVQNLLPKHLIQLDSIQCDCARGMDFSPINLGVTIIYPEQLRLECIGCVKKAKSYFTKVLFLTDSLGLDEYIQLTCAGANECLIKETFCLAESSVRELSK